MARTKDGIEKQVTSKATKKNWKKKRVNDKGHGGGEE
jgi:hypothetical protein